MKYFFKISSRAGVTLVELLITMAIFTIVTGLIFSTYTIFMKHATTERKITKTELDILNLFWPALKDMQAAGFGISKALTPIQLNGSELIILSTATGSDKYSGLWSYVDNECKVSGIPDGEYVSVISSVDRSLLGYSKILNSKLADITCTAKITKSGYVAYWIPNTTQGYYEVRFDLKDYSGDKPFICSPGTAKFSKSLSSTATSNYEPLLHCVLKNSLNYRFGCIDASGNILWKTDPNSCGTAKLRLLRIGFLIQSSPRMDAQGPNSITFFEDLAPSLRITLNLTNDQRYYKWRKIEETIPLRNLE